MEKNFQYYIDLPYTRELIPEPEGGWFVRVKELPGCMSQGDTPEEAMEMINEAMELWLETALDHGMTIPEPRMDEDYSGKFVARLPKSLHRKCVERADEDEVSLNQWVVSALSEAVGNAWNRRLAQTEISAEPRTDYPEWPGLSDAVIHILQDVGYDIEVGKYDESLFGGWLLNNLADIKECIKMGDYAQALSCTQPLEETLAAHKDRSPIVDFLASFVDEISLLISHAKGLEHRVLIEENRTAQIRALILNNYQAKVTPWDSEKDRIEKRALSKSEYSIKETQEYPYKAERYTND